MDLPALPPQPAPFLFAQGFAPGDERPFAGDLDGDGYAELIAVTGDGTVFVCRNEAGQKIHAGECWARGFATGEEPVAAGDFTGNGRLGLAAIRRDGRVSLARASAGATTFDVTATAGVAPVWGDVALRAGDADGDRIDDLYVMCAGAGAGAEVGEVFLLRSNGRGGFESGRLLGLAPREAMVGDFDGDRRADLAWIEGGKLVVALGRGIEAFGAPQVVTVTGGAPAGPMLAVGHADGDGRMEVALEGAWLVFAGTGAALEARILPDARLSRPAGAACVLADVDADGCADLVTFARRDRCDVRVALARFPSWYAGAPPGSKDTDGDGLTDFEEAFVYHTNPLVRDTDGDGLLDGWEAKGSFRGVRLDRMGADPRHKDIFLELDVEVGADMARVDRAIERMVKLYGQAPVENPDGRAGIAIHCLVDTRVPRWPPGGEPGPGRQELRELFFTPQRAGIFHWMHLAAEGGGGQADLLADQGSCAGIFEATLPHEFGHQLGLNHGGGDGMNGIPHYPSLMNYAYNYQLNGRLEDTGYSRGALAHLALDENALPERLAVAFADLTYLGGPPFHFRIEPRDGGRATWVDWNRDGVEQTAPVRANINAASGEGYGSRPFLDQVAPLGGGRSTRTLEQPALVTIPARGETPETLVLLYVPREGGGLAVRVLEVDDIGKFGPDGRVVDAPADLHAITAAVDAAGRVHVVGTSAGRVVEVVLARDGPRPLDARGGFCEWPGDFGIPAVTCSGERIFVARRFEDGRLSVERRSVGADGSSLPEDTAPAVVAGVRSSVPAALAFDTLKDELLVATSDPGSDRMRLSRLDPRTLTLTSTEPVGGERAGDATNQRAAILFETAPWLPPEGCIDLFVAGRYDLANHDPANCTHMFRCYTIGDKAWLGRAGWKCDMTWNEWTYTLSGVAVAWFHGRPWHAGRYFTLPGWDANGLKDSICIAPNADGICDSGLRDWNDWEIVTGVGLERSILEARTPRGRR